MYILWYSPPFCFYYFELKSWLYREWRRTQWWSTLLCQTQTVVEVWFKWISQIVKCLNWSCFCCWCCYCHTIWDYLRFSVRMNMTHQPPRSYIVLPFFAILCLMKCMHCRKYVRVIVVHMLVNKFLPPLLQSSYLSEGCTGVQSYYLPIFKPNIEFRT